MKKYIRNPRHTEVHDVRGKKRKASIEKENEQQDDKSKEKDGE